MAPRKYTRQFKESAVGLVQQQGYTVSEAAKSLGVDAANIRNWLKKFGGDVGVPAAGSDVALRAENQRLRKDNARLLMEREILKKRRRSSPGSSHEVCLRSESLSALADHGDVPGAGRQSQRVRRVVETWAQCAGATS